MAPGSNNVPKNIGAVQPAKSAVATAAVAGAFSAVFLVLLVVNYIQVSIMMPRREAELTDLKVKIQKQADDKELLAQIRALDLRIRQQRLRRLDFSRKCGYMLLGGVVVFLAGVIWADSHRKKRPTPGPVGNQRNEQIFQAARSRLAVAIGLVVLAAVGIFLVVAPRINFAEAEAEGPSYPSDEEIAKNWHRFRGPGGAGISAYTNIPTRWDGKTGEGILWKTEVPLPGHNSPVVWGDRVFLSGATEQKREVYCFDAISGKLLWTGEVPKASREKLEIKEDTGAAACTVASDGRRVYAIFASGDIGCFDFKGSRLWTKSLGIPDSAYGYASSLEVYQNLLLVQFDQATVEDGKSRLFAFDGLSGRPVWEVKRPVANSWTSPIVVKAVNKYQLITVADPWVISYEPASGKEIWRAKCVGGDVAPSSICAGGLVFVIEPYKQLVAIRPDGQGDITRTHIAWRAVDSGPDICCPVSNGELIYVLTTEGMLICHRVADGTKVYEKDLNATFLASPSLAGDKMYLLSEKGVMYLVQTGSEYKELGRCELGEDCWASPAFADGRIYLRGLKTLYCIGNKP